MSKLLQKIEYKFAPDATKDSLLLLVEEHKTELKLDEKGINAIKIESRKKSIDYLKNILEPILLTELTEQLIDEEKGNVNVKDPVDGFTPLHIQSDIIVIKILLDHGANPNISDNRGYTPMHVQGSWPHYAKKVREAMDKKTKKEEEEAERKAIEEENKKKKAETNKNNWNKEKIEKKEVSKEASKDIKKETIIEIPENVNKSILKLLISYGANVNIRTNSEFIPLSRNIIKEIIQEQIKELDTIEKDNVEEKINKK